MLTLARGNPLVGEDLLQLIDDERQMTFNSYRPCVGARIERSAYPRGQCVRLSGLERGKRRPLPECLHQR